MSYREWRVTPYLIHGVKLFGAEDQSQYTDSYHDTRKDAQDRCDELNAD